MPEDISVIGFDDIPIASYRDIQLSTILQPRYRIGQYAAEKMLKLLPTEVEERRCERKNLLPELVVRRSS